jgi:beta-mannosidase
MRFPATKTLDGPWQILPVEEFSQGLYTLDDACWLEQSLPAHWQQHPLLERYAGKMVYRARCGLPGPADEGAPAGGAARYWLRLNGVFYWSQPYFNGIDLGRHEGYFEPQEHDVSAWVERENTVVIEVECPDEHEKFSKRLITGVFSHWDALDPATNPGGIWLPVELIRSGPARISGVRLQTESASALAAELRFRATIDSAGARDVTLRWTLTPANFAGAVQTIEQPWSLADGAQTIAGTLEVRDPQLWWTHDMGFPHLYRVSLDIVEDGSVSDTYTCTFGIRTFALRDWIGYLNGVRFLIKGNNYPPGDMRIASMTRAAYDRDLELARACHMNMLRVHAHVEHPAFYEAADAAGILVWQDFPLQWLYQREVLPEARRQVVAMVDLLANHPSVAIWCMHNEPIYTGDTRDERLLTRARSYVSVFLWSWNRDVMDSQLKQLTLEADPTRPAVRSSGEYAVPLWRPGTDGHFYHGWYMIYGYPHTWATIAQRFPNNIRFITEFGSQSFPNLESCEKFMDADIANIDWDLLTERHHFQANILDHWVEWRGVGSLADLIELTQDYQIAINRFYIDRLRFYKYRPTGGIIPFMFHDSNPAVQWSIIDYWRVPKRSYGAMRLAFAPQYVFTLLDRREYRLGAPLELPIYMVNDAHRTIPIGLRARLYAPDGRELATIERQLDLPADCMALEIERLRLTPTQTGTYRLALEWGEPGGEQLQQSYDVEVPA